MSKTNLTKLLTESLAALEKDRIGEALSRLHDAWGAYPSRAIGELAELVAQRHPASPVSKTADWLAAAKRGAMEERAGLVASFCARGLDDTFPRFEAARDWGPDPLVALELERILRRVPWTSNSSQKVWRRIFALVTLQKAPIFVDLAAELTTSWGIRGGHKEWMTAAFAKALVGVPKALAPLAAGDQRLLDKLKQALTRKISPSSQRTDAGLLAAVFDQPASDEARAVYADFLMENNDERGEFISLQLLREKTAQQEKRERALLKAHGKAWLGKLAGALGAKVEYQRGFLAKATVKFRNEQDAANYAGLAEWATLEEADWSENDWVLRAEGRDWVHHIGPAFRHLRCARRISLEDLLRSKDVTWALEEVIGYAKDADTLKAVLTSGQLPKLRSLVLDGEEVKLEWFRTIPKTTKVEALGLQRLQIKDSIVDFVAAVEALPNVQRFVWAGLEFSRDAKGKLSKLHVLSDDWRNYQAEPQLDDFLPGSISELTAVDNKQELCKGLERLLGKDTGTVVRKYQGVEEIQDVVGAETWVVAGERELLVLDPNTGNTMHSFEYPKAASVKVTRDAAHAVMLYEGELVVHGVATGKIEWRLALPNDEELDNDAYTISLSANGERGLVVCRCLCYFIDLVKGVVVRTVPNPCWGGTINPEGTRVVLAERDTMVLYQFAAKGAPEKIKVAGLHSSDFAFIGDEKIALVVEKKQEDYLTFYHWSSKRLEKVCFCASRLVISPDRKKLFGQTYSGGVVFDTKSPTPLLTLPDKPVHGAFASDNSLLLVTKRTIEKIQL